ncbi:hypothetical protein V493_05634 [Pseudogymnoascus sp. VKM F-4281 (FW-2241)]|nr:hypothetical protein V493_05634 [Pseudogymnoascus sp. VKM F-4281 (FW-2241)]
MTPCHPLPPRHDVRLLAPLAEARGVAETAWEEQRRWEKAVGAVCFEGRVLEEGEEGSREPDYGRLRGDGGGCEETVLWRVWEGASAGFVEIGGSHWLNYYYAHVSVREPVPVRVVNDQKPSVVVVVGDLEGSGLLQYNIRHGLAQRHIKGPKLVCGAP